MQFMAKDRFAGHADIFHLMALDAVPFYRESGFAVMTGTASLAPLHLGHAEMGIFTVCFEDTVVAVTAGVHFQVLAMTEGQGAEIRNDYGYVADRVAFCTVFQLRCTGIALVVAGSARPAGLHVRHGIYRIIFPYYMEDLIVAG
jgi:hypothetical protein